MTDDRDLCAMAPYAGDEKIELLRRMARAAETSRLRSGWIVAASEDDEHIVTDILRTPDEWCVIKGIRIKDPDGWRGKYVKVWDEPIDEWEFIRRAGMCTIERRP